MKSSATTFFYFLISGSVFSQSIRGQVQDTDGKPMPFVNVLLLNSKDSTLVKGTVSDAAGAYTIDQVKQGNYVVSASMVGYKRGFVPPVTVTDGQADLKAPLLQLAPETRQLAEVAVTAKRPFVEQQIDRMVINVANSIIASGSTALEVLEKSPGVSVDRQNDAIQLRGKDGVIVQINGKQTYLAMADVVALLRGMSSDNIDRIELITNPSAKYDAAGNAGIIDIRLKKNNNVGTNGTLSVAGGTGRFNRERGSLQLNHRTRSLNLFGNYSGNQGGNYWDFATFRNQADLSNPARPQRNLAYQDSYFRFLEWGHNATAGFDLLPGKNTTIGLVWTGFWSNHDEEGPAVSAFKRAENEPVYFRAQTDKTQGSLSSNHIGNLNIQHTFGKKGGQVSADVNVGRFQRTYTNSLLTRTVLPEIPAGPLSGLFILMPTTIDLRTIKADYNRTLGSSWRLEAGLKNSSVLSDNNMTLSRGEGSVLQRDSALSNRFRYTEKVNAAYVNFSGKLDSRMDIQVGLRAEHTHSEGNLLSTQHVVTRNYLNLFPSLFITRALTKDHSLNVSYSRRIDRPNYQNLNPARSYADPYAYSRGNAFLKPQYTHSLELKHGFRNKLFTSFGASYTNDLIYYLIQPVENNKFERYPENIGKSQAYNLTVSFPVAILKGWVLQTSLLGIYRGYDFVYQETPVRVKQISGRINGSNAITLGNGWTAELTGWLNTPAVDAIWYSPWMGSLDAGLQKAVGSRLKAKLSVQDVFHTNRILGTIKAPDFTSNVRIALDTRIAILNLTYTFGNQQIKGIRQRRTGSEEEINRAN
ncbi:outer membrane beta-barrel family protein [Nibrella viscosa]|uniref:Outer membrane beta-barrel family protein n=1 Tax=Nibrella viscosa TaxID=1084524 RepID=A0ABP8K6F8_9BACT